MMKATMYQIVNHSSRDIVLWPIDEELRKEWGLLIKAGHFIAQDFRFQGLLYAIDFDECFFQFVGKKRKIKPKNIQKHGIEIFIYE